ncbi:MAG TPA: dTMP kinase [Thermoanaerobaculia bacterium]|jgi:dTMP kinase|nr:dTMP kinase [Thermoanaerobaculia bacterium]
MSALPADRPARGLFVTFEGIDGSGKSTLLRRAGDWLAGRGLGVRTTHEPGGTPLGDAIRGIFLDPRWGEVDGTVELLLVFASRRQHLSEVIDPALAEGLIVLCDRFTDSTLAYQGAGRGVPRQRIDEIDRIATAHRRPDLTLYFDLPLEEAERRMGAVERGGHDRLDGESRAFAARVRDGFRALAAAEPERFRTIDAAGPIAATEAAVRAALAAALGFAP